MLFSVAVDVATPVDVHFVAGAPNVGVNQNPRVRPKRGQRSSATAPSSTVASSKSSTLSTYSTSTYTASTIPNSTLLLHDQHNSV